MYTELLIVAVIRTAVMITFLHSSNILMLAFVFTLSCFSYTCEGPVGAYVTRPANGTKWAQNTPYHNMVHIEFCVQYLLSVNYKNVSINLLMVKILFI